MTKNYIIITLFFSFALFKDVNSDNTFEIITLMKVAVRKEPNIKSPIVDYIEKGKRLKMLKKEGDFAKIFEGRFIYKEGIKILKLIPQRLDGLSIEVFEKKYGQKLDRATKDGLSLNNGDKEYIEIMKIDTLDFDSIKN